MSDRLMNLYRLAFLRKPWIALLVTLVPVAVLASFIPNFKLDVSSEALILEDDPALRVYDASRLVFGSDDYVILSFRAKDVFSDENIRLISSLTRDLSAVSGVDRVMSITSVRLYLSPPGSLFGLIGGGGESITLDSAKCDRALARKELTESGIYSKNLVSADGTRTSLLVFLLQKSEGHGMEKRIHEIDRLLEAGEGDPATLRAEQAEIKKEFQIIVDVRRDRRQRVMEDIRTVLGKYEATGKTFYGSGLPLIFSDMMAYVRRDMTLFGSIVAGFLFLVLGIVFRRLRWVVLPMTAGLATVALVVGAMVAADIRTTVITSNLTSLLMILTMAHSIHFAVRYDEECALDPGASRRDRIARAVRHIGVPCFYISATTAVGFLSLIISGIRPVIEFGQFMSLGVMLAFVMTFLLVPGGLALWPIRRRVAPPPAVPSEKGAYQSLAALTGKFRWVILAASAALTAFSIVGIAKLDVETIFIDYFRKDTEIYRGLKFIDQEMGGTSSLEVILTAEEEKYFTTWEHLEPLQKIEAYLETVPEVGKILSPLTLMGEINRILVTYGLPPPPGKEMHSAGTLLDPLARMGTDTMGEGRAPLYAYLDPTFKTARVFVRIQETAPDLNRRRLVGELREFLAREVRVPGVKVEVTGVFVLYANMLHSLFAGQIKTTALVFGAVLVMMIVLFRSVRLGLLALVPNVIPILFVLGTMGWLGVNLDMNNIMVASVTLGIAVDDTLHYLFRFKREIRRDWNYERAMARTHKTIGKAIVLTSVVIISGFSVLAFSNFIPTRNFGVFSSIAMIAALLAAITLLPALILILKPFGRAPATEDGEPPAENHKAA